MSNQKQYSPVQPTADSRQANFETALRIATIMAEANEHLFRLQSEAANAAFTENAKQLKALLNTKDSASCNGMGGSLSGEYAQDHRGHAHLLRDRAEDPG
jgi:hypothetical protein